MQKKTQKMSKSWLAKIKRFLETRLSKGKDIDKKEMGRIKEQLVILNNCRKNKLGLVLIADKKEMIFYLRGSRKFLIQLFSSLLDKNPELIKDLQSAILFVSIKKNLNPKDVFPVELIDRGSLEKFESLRKTIREGKQEENDDWRKYVT